MPYKSGNWGYQAKNRSIQRAEYFKEHKRKMRLSCIEFMGGKCVKCGFSDLRALQIDHVNGGGSIEIKSRSSSYSYYKQVMADLTGKYQLLCANCNWIKKWEKEEVGKYNGSQSSPSRM